MKKEYFVLYDLYEGKMKKKLTDRQRLYDKLLREMIRQYYTEHPDKIIFTLKEFLDWADDLEEKDEISNADFLLETNEKTKGIKRGRA